jgi:purine nucleoside permease
LTKETALLDTPKIAERRALFNGYPEAQRPPFVLQGGYLAAMNFWHGELENRWANRWVEYWTSGEGEFVASAMEGSGMMIAMEFLDQAGIVDRDRVLMLRAASNYTMQWPGATAHESKTGESLGGYSAFIPAIENAYTVGSPVVRALVRDWESHRLSPPTP